MKKYLKQYAVYILLLLLITWIIIEQTIHTQFSIIDYMKGAGIGHTISELIPQVISIITVILLFIALNKQIESNKYNQIALSKQIESNKLNEIALSDQIESNKFNREESNFNKVHQAINILENGLIEFQYELKKGNEAIDEFFAHANNSILLRTTNDREYGEYMNKVVKRFNLLLLGLGRVFYLKENLETNETYKDVINSEIIHLWDYYLETAYSISSDWLINLKIENSELLRVYESLQKELDIYNQRTHKLQFELKKFKQ